MPSKAEGPPPFDSWHAPDPECDEGEWMAREIEANLNRWIPAHAEYTGSQQGRPDPMERKGSA